MKRLIILLTIFFLILVSFTGCTTSSNKEEKLKVAVSIYPFYDAVKSIGGDLVDVITIVPPGSSPHTYTLTPKDISLLSDVKVVFVNDFGLEAFLDNLLKSLKVKVVNVSEPLKAIVESHNGNPHLWLNPEYFIVQAGVIKDTLIELDPTNKNFYESNYNDYKEKILNHAKLLKIRVITLDNRNVITFHDAFPYFAEYFGLNIVATIEADPNKLPTPRELATIESLIKKYNIKVVFKEPQLSSDIYRALVEDTGVKVLQLDPLGDGVNIKTYIDLMDYNINAIAQAEGK